MIRASVFLALAFALACGSEPAARATVVRDSAGIAIVENDAPAWEEGEEWRISSEPLVTIGVAEGPEEYMLFGADAALRMPDGGILVVNSGTSELRFYDPTGRYRFAVGRQGGGPGEFVGLGRVWRYRADSILAFDMGNNRMVVLGQGGEFGRTFVLAPGPGSGPGYVQAPFADGTLLVEASPTRSGGSPGLAREDALFHRYGPEGAFLDMLARRPGAETHTADLGGRLMRMSRPYGRRPVSAVDGDRWYYGSADAFEIEAYDAGGRLARIVRAAIENRPITPEIAEEYRTRTLGANPRVPEAMRRRIAEIPLPASMPAYSRLLVDDERNLWVREHGRVGAGEPWRWVVFDPDGRLLGHVDPPADGMWATHIGSDFVLGTWNDELDVERVRMYRLVKP